MPFSPPTFTFTASFQFETLVWREIKTIVLRLFYDVLPEALVLLCSLELSCWVFYRTTITFSTLQVGGSQSVYNRLIPHFPSSFILINHSVTYRRYAFISPWSLVFLSERLFLNHIFIVKIQSKIWLPFSSIMWMLKAVCRSSSIAVTTIWSVKDQKNPERITDLLEKKKKKYRMNSKPQLIFLLALLVYTLLNYY